MRTGRPKAALHLSDAEKKELQRLSRRRVISAMMGLRARAILMCAEGTDSKSVAQGLGVSEHAVGKWRRRFLEKRLDGLLDEPRVGRPRKVTDERVEQLIVETLESTPRAATHWSTREMARRSGLSTMTISRIWRAYGLQPHRAETFQLSKDPQLIDKVRDIVGLYLSPPANAAVFCVDEKSAIQALNRTQPILPLRPGQAERRTNEYERHGYLDLFAALNVATGEVLGVCRKRHRSSEFVQFLDQVDNAVPPDLDIHLVLDNLATHKTPRVHRWLIRHPRVVLHFTPTHASWLNQVERWFGGLTANQLRRGSHKSTSALKAAIEAYIAKTNASPKPFLWVKSADQILENIARFATRTLVAHAKD